MLVVEESDVLEEAEGSVRVSADVMGHIGGAEVVMFRDRLVKNRHGEIPEAVGFHSSPNV